MQRELAVSGMGVVAPIGQGKAGFTRALLAGEHAFDLLRRAGRQNDSAFIGAEISHVELPDSISRQTARTASLTAQLALLVLEEAWSEARLYEVDPTRIGLIVGGSNIQQRELMLVQESYRGRQKFLRPTYGMAFMDSDVCGVCTAHFGIRGAAFTVGGASASGQLAIIQAAQAVLAGQVDVCIALGALSDLSYWECQGLRSLGAMGSDRFAHEPALACRPFDRDHDGFIFGESSGAIVLESLDSCVRRGARPYALLQGWGLSMDANRNPDPSLAGEVRAIQSAIQASGEPATRIDYVNPHGSGSVAGDETEARALHAAGLSHAKINATKSLIGHGLSAAGTVEVIATLLQMQAGALHPTRNLDRPIDSDLDWVRDKVQCEVERALTLSMGFGGINTAMCWQRCASV